MNMLPVYINAGLGLIIFVCCVLAVLNYQDELDALDRFILAGIAGSMIIVTPALWDTHSPFDGWSYNVSRAFFAAFFVKRMLLPVLWKWKARAREDIQIAQSGARLADRMRHKL